MSNRKLPPPPLSTPKPQSPSTISQKLMSVTIPDSANVVPIEHRLPEAFTDTPGVENDMGTPLKRSYRLVSILVCTACSAYLMLEADGFEDPHVFSGVRRWYILNAPWKSGILPRNDDDEEDDVTNEPHTVMVPRVVAAVPFISLIKHEPHDLSAVNAKTVGTNADPGVRDKTSDPGDKTAAAKPS